MPKRASHISRTAALLIGAALAVMAGPSYAESVPPAGGVADLCPVVDARDTIQSVRDRVASRLGAPIKEETVDTQYVLTFRRKNGSDLFVILTRDSNKLEVSCYESKS